MEKEKWIDSVFESLEGSQRAKPQTDLFAAIESQLDAPEAKIIPVAQWRAGVAAAIIILVLNVFALQQFNQNRSLIQKGPLMEEDAGESLISNYKLYN